MQTTEVLRAGVYAPILTPFKDDGSSDIDLEAFAASVARLGRADIGLIIGGTLGEGPLLDRAERDTLLKCARDTLRDLNLSTPVPIIAGIMGQSVRECVASSKDAAKAGADAVIVVAPAYFAFVYGKNRYAVKDFFSSIADKSPLPVFLYNIPFAAGGIDMDAAFLVDIAEHQNIAGVKLTCLNIAKGHCVALHVDTPEYRARHPKPFLVLPGSTDYMVPGLIARQHGCMGGPANLYPKICVKLFRTATEALKTGNMELLKEAMALQDLVTRSDSVINKVGFLGIKTALEIHVDGRAGGSFRKPLSPLSDDAAEELRQGLAEIMKLENSL